MGVSNTLIYKPFSYTYKTPLYTISFTMNEPIRKQPPIPNDRINDITIEEVKALTSFKDYSEEQIQQLIQTIKTFTRIGYSIFLKQQAITGKVINLPTAENKQKAA